MTSSETPAPVAGDLVDIVDMARTRNTAPGPYRITEVPAGRRRNFAAEHCASGVQVSGPGWVFKPWEGVEPPAADPAAPVKRLALGAVCKITGTRAPVWSVGKLWVVLGQMADGTYKVAQVGGAEKWGEYRTHIGRAMLTEVDPAVLVTAAG